MSTASVVDVVVVDVVVVEVVVGVVVEGPVYGGAAVVGSGLQVLEANMVGISVGDKTSTSSQN